MPPETTIPLKFGSRSPREMELPRDAVISGDALTGADPIKNPTRVVVDSLAAPVNFPPLSQSVVPGDLVAIALDEGLPRRAELVAGAVESILAAGISPEDITLVEPARAAPELEQDAQESFEEVDPRSQLSPEIANRVQWAVHSPDTVDSLFYLGASKQNRPIYINRAIGEADFVLPIVCRRPSSTVSADAVFNGLFPQFADREMLDRFQTPGGMQSAVQRKQRAEEVDAAGDLVGVFLSVEVVPGAEGQVSTILAGESKAVASLAREFSRNQWCFEVPQRFDLVVALIEGEESEQSWSNFARALAAASSAVAVEGAIAICCELDAEPSAVLEMAAQTDDLVAGLREIQRRHSPDAWAAMELTAALAQGPVFLLSHLDGDTVETLGMAPVEDAEELSRLSQRHGQCLVLRNAQHTQPVVLGE